LVWLAIAMMVKMSAKKRVRAGKTLFDISLITVA
jgi:hypothetical protein